MARASRNIPGEAVAYLSPFENHPRAVAALAADRVLGVTHRRHSEGHASVCACRGVEKPRLCSASSFERFERFELTRTICGSANPFARVVGPESANGRGSGRRAVCIYRKGSTERPGRLFCRGRRRVRSDWVLTPARGRCDLRRRRLSLLRQHPCSSATRSSPTAPQCSMRACDVAQFVSSTFGLVGLNGVDFIERDGILYPVEVDPRWSSSIEIAERAFASVLSRTCRCLQGGALPSFDCATALEGCERCRQGDRLRPPGCVGWRPSSWLEDSSVRDVPRSVERFRPGQPICSVFATAAGGAACTGSSSAVPRVSTPSWNQCGGPPAAFAEATAAKEGGHDERRRIGHARTDIRPRHRGHRAAQRRADVPGRSGCVDQGSRAVADAIPRRHCRRENGSAVELQAGARPLVSR